MLSSSVAGVSIDGGRFNRPGVEALYLSRSAQTALEEYKQGSSITAPPWKLADLVITAGFRDIVFPSLRHAGGTNPMTFAAPVV